MRIDWDVPIAMDDGLVVRADVFRPDRRRASIRSSSPTAPMRRASRSRTAIRARGSAWSRSTPTSRRARPTSIKAGRWSTRRNGCRTAMRACAWIRAARAARPAIIDHFSPRETKDFYDCIEWAGVQPWSNGKVGLNGISYYGINAVARRLVAAAAPRRDVRVGRRGRLVSRHDASRRHALDLLGQLVRHAGEDRAVRRGRARQALARARRTGVRAGDASARSSLRRTAATSARRSARIRSTTTITRRARRSGTRSRRRCSRRRTGADRACIRAAISKALRAPPRRTNGSKRTASSTGRISTRTTAASCSASSSTFSSKAKTPAGDSSRACCCRCAIRARSSSSAPKIEWPIARTKWTKLYLNPADFSLTRDLRVTGEAKRSTFDALGEGVTFMTPPLHADTEITGPVAAKLFVSSSTTRRRPVPDPARVLRRHEGDRVPGRDRSAHADRARLAARLAPQARSRSSPCPTGPITPTTRFSR